MRGRKCALWINKRHMGVCAHDAHMLIQSTVYTRITRIYTHKFSLQTFEEEVEDENS